MALQSAVATDRRGEVAEISLQVDDITHGDVDEKVIRDGEGRKRIVQHVSYERSRKNRDLAVRIHGTVCHVCGFDFDEVYGRRNRLASRLTQVQRPISVHSIPNIFVSHK
jgi:predicted HNH restriction endonuclease